MGGLQPSTRVVGQSIPRVDARSKVLGEARYADDLSLPGMVYGKVLRSPHPHAHIRSIDPSRALGQPDVVAVLTAADIPGAHTIGPIIKDQPILCQDEVRYVGDPVALVVAESQEAAERALALVQVQYAELPAVLDPLEALRPEAPQVHPGGNIGAHPKVRRCDVAAAFRQAEVVVEGRFVTQRIEHAYIEPEAALATLSPQGGIIVWSTTQYPHHDQEEVARMLGLPLSRVRVIQMTSGGGFGGKSGAPLPQCYAALMAWKTGRPAKVLYSRDESIVVSPKRHPQVVNLKLGATREGKLLAAQATIVGDTGAYLMQGRSVLTKSATHVTGPYYIPNIQVDAYAVFTHTVPCGAMRGYGVPQVSFACEALMDELAARVGLDPVEVRQRNALDTTVPNATGRVMTASIPFKEMLRRADRAMHSMRQVAQHAPPGRRRGVGVAAAVHGIGSIRKPSRSTAIVHLLADGSATVVCGHVELGQGSNTMMAQVAAEVLGLEVSQVQVVTNDTALTPDCETTSATRVTYLSGNAVRRAAAQARQQVLDLAAQDLGCAPEELDLVAGTVVPRGDQERGIPLADLFRRHVLHSITAVGEFTPEITPLDPDTGQGSPMGTYGFAAHVALVEVDEGTGQTRVLQYVAINDAGRMLNPLAVKGQMHSGVVMGLGYALTEEVKLEHGQVTNTSFATYQIPTTFDLPRELLLDILEDPEPTGPFGAKGMSEPATDPVGAAIANAVSDAIGVRVTELPMTSERVHRLLQEASASASERPGTEEPLAIPCSQEKPPPSMSLPSAELRRSPHDEAGPGR